MEEVSTSESHTGSRPAAGGGDVAQRGFDFQMNVSILAALRIMLMTKSATRITLEPANEEDLEADLVEDAPGRIEPHAVITGGYRLIIQVKLTTGEPWSLANFDALLRHGKKRTPARDHLKDENTRYLLVTSGDAKGEARNLLVGDFEESADATDFPASLRGTLDHSPEGRVAIWGGLTERLVELETAEILGTILKVPKASRDACRDALRNEARRRMQGSSAGVWTREDLVGTIRSFGGYLASAAQLETFVEPSNFSDMLTQLSERNAVVITGPSGTGKTIAAIALCNAARSNNGDLQVVTVSASDDPARTRGVAHTGPTLYYIEDPWGQYSLRGDHEAWTDQLPRLLNAASSNHQYVVTSRSDMLGQANAAQKFRRWALPLEPDHYRTGQLAQIYDKRMDLLATDQQSKALKFRKRVLDVLETPLELDLFFSNLGDRAVSANTDEEQLRALLEISHRDAVEDIVVRYLETHAAGVAAVIWALLVARSAFERTQLTAISRQLRLIDEPVAVQLSRLVDRLIATRHLRQPGQSVSFAHPSVRSGFETYLKDDWLSNETALQGLVDALVTMPAPHSSWGVETAARVLDEARKFAERSDEIDGFEISADSQSRIDLWLEDALVDQDSDFQPLLQLAAGVGSSSSIPSEVARWFIKGVQRGGNVFLNDWKPPDFDDRWYDDVSSDPRSAIISDRFIREQLPHDTSMFGVRFPERLDRIARGLTPAFLDAAHQVVKVGFDRNITAIAAGAVRDLAAYESVLGEALDELARITRVRTQEHEEKWQALEDGEFDAGYEEHYRSAHEDDGYAANVLVDTYISAVRAAGRWSELTTHPRAHELASHWAHAVTKVDDARSDEVLAVLDAAETAGCETNGWEAARLNWYEELAPRLASRIASKLNDQRLRTELARCALARAERTIVEAAEAFANDTAELVQLIVDTNAAQDIIPRDVRVAGFRSLMSALPAPVAEIFRALPYRKRAAAQVGQEAINILERAAASAPVAVLEAIVPVLIASGVKPTAAIHRWLTSTIDASSAEAAAEAAVEVGADDVILEALGHPRANARLVALQALGPEQPCPLPPEFLALATDPGSRVRRAMVKLLSSEPHPEHYQALMKLTKDAWSNADLQYDEPESYPIAREAVISLMGYNEMPADDADQLIALATRTRDRELRQVALSTASALGGAEARQNVWQLVVQKPASWTNVDALDALASAPSVEAGLVSQVTAESIFALPPPIAASATMFAATHRPPEEAVQILERMAHQNSHRALVLIGALGLESRDPQAARQVLDLLEVNHPARRLLDWDVELPTHVLDDLGDVRLRDHVRGWISDRIAKPPKSG